MLTRAHPEDRARSVADVQHALSIERKAAGDADFPDEGIRAAVRRDAIDHALEAARHVQRIVGAEHHRRRIHDGGGERFTGAGGMHPEDRDGHLLAARSAVGHIQAALAIEDGVVHLVQARRQRARDNECGVTVHTADPYGDASAASVTRHPKADAARRREHGTHFVIADEERRRQPAGREPCAREDHESSRTGPCRIDVRYVRGLVHRRHTGTGNGIWNAVTLTQVGLVFETFCRSRLRVRIRIRVFAEPDSESEYDVCGRSPCTLADVTTASCRRARDSNRDSRASSRARSAGRS